MAFGGAWSDAHKLGRVSYGSAGFDEGGEDVHLARGRVHSSYLLRLGDQLADPFEWTADRFLLAESFARLDLTDRGACQHWFRQHGAVDQGGLQGVVRAAELETGSGRRRWDSEDDEASVAAEQESVAWLLLTLQRLSDQRESKDWDPAWGRVILDGAAEGMIIGGPDAGSLVWPSLAWESWIETHQAEPATRAEVEKQTRLLSDTEGWPRVTVIEFQPGNLELAPTDGRALSVASEAEARADVLGTTWQETVKLVRLIIEPYLQRAVERLFTTEFVPQKSDRREALILIPHEERIWRSILSPIYLQLFEALRRITEGEPGAAVCRECGRPFLVLDARRRFFCNDRERFRHAQRERRRRLRTEETPK